MNVTSARAGADLSRRRIRQHRPGASLQPAKLPIDAPERRRLPLLLRRAWYGLNQAFRRRMTPLGLTPDQFTVLRTLLENEGVTQRELTELMSSDPNTVAALVERMETMGLVERQAREKDRRTKSLRPNSPGKSPATAAGPVEGAVPNPTTAHPSKTIRTNILCRIP